MHLSFVDDYSMHKHTLHTHIISKNDKLMALIRISFAFLRSKTTQFIMERTFLALALYIFPGELALWLVSYPLSLTLAPLLPPPLFLSSTLSLSLSLALSFSPPPPALSLCRFLSRSCSVSFPLAPWSLSSLSYCAFLSISAIHTLFLRFIWPIKTFRPLDRPGGKL